MKIHDYNVKQRRWKDFRKAFQAFWQYSASGRRGYTIHIPYYVARCKDAPNRNQVSLLNIHFWWGNLNWSPITLHFDHVQMPVYYKED